MSNPAVSDVRPIDASTVASFDHETDVVVVGFGVAGGAAAFEAAKAGADVIVLERASGPGGSSAQSGGELYLGGGTPLQKANGFDDDANGMFEYLRVALGPNADEEKLRLYAEGSVELFEWFKDLGLEFESGFYDFPSWMPHTKDGLMWLGENAWPYNEVTTAVPRGHRPATELFGGWLLMDKLAAKVAELGAATHTDTRAVALIVEDGRVVGVKARKFGEDVTYRARKGVVITTGGFVDNEDMVRAHVPQLLGQGKVSDGGDDGSGILLAQAVGAAVRRMAEFQLSYTASPAMVANGILVNARGERFINEDVYPGLWSHAAFKQPGPVWVIMDEEGYEALNPYQTMGVQPTHAAETLAELEEELGMPAGSLEYTVAAYNKGAQAGADELRKDPRWVKELKAPFAAFNPLQGFAGLEESSGDGGYAGFTLGGLHTNPDGEVLDITGVAIPGLYAAGRATSGIHGQGYISGTSLGDGSFFGRRAGQKVAGA